MIANQPVEVYKVVAGGRDGFSAWVSGYRFVCNDGRCAILSIDGGLFAGVHVRYPLSVVRESKSS